MKIALTALLAGALIVFSGCDTGSPGGPGAVPSRTTTDTTPSSDVRDNDRDITDVNVNRVDNDRTDESLLRETQRSVIGPEDNTFLLDVPNLSTDIKQGETKAVKIGINRGDNMGEDVTLSFSSLPPGVTIEPANPVIKHGEKEATVMIKAAADAALGDFTVKVNGHPTTGADANNEFKISINQM